MIWLVHAIGSKKKKKKKKKRKGSKIRHFRFHFRSHLLSTGPLPGSFPYSHPGSPISCFSTCPSVGTVYAFTSLLFVTGFGKTAYLVSNQIACSREYNDT